MNSKLRDLLYSGEFDWDDLRQRIAYLKDWVKGDIELREMGWLTIDGERHAEDDA